MEPSEIGHVGEQHVVSDLRKKGFNIENWDTKLPGSTDIEASKNGLHRLIQVKTGVRPNLPGDMSDEENRNISSRASRIGAYPYLAKVQLTVNFALERPVEYYKV